MSLILFPPLPFDTAQAAESVFGREHPYLRIGGSLEKLWEELQLSTVGFNDPFLTHSFFPYSFVTVLQYWEYLTDRQMSQATRTRLDMKYALHLPLNFPGVEPADLCEFRQHVRADEQAYDALQRIVNTLHNYTEMRTPRLCVKDMLAAICLPSRAEIILDCMAISLEAVASTHPIWLKAHALPHWYRRYSRKSVYEKIPRDPLEIETLILSVGNDGWHLLKRIKTSNDTSLRKLSEIAQLEKEWERQFVIDGDGLKFRQSHCLTCSSELNLIVKKRQEKGKESRN